MRVAAHDRVLVVDAALVSHLDGTRKIAVAVVAAGALGTNFCIYSTQLSTRGGSLVSLPGIPERPSLLDKSGSPGPSCPRAVGGALAGVAFLNDYVVMLAVAALGIATFLAAIRLATDSRFWVRPGAIAGYLDGLQLDLLRPSPEDRIHVSRVTPLRQPLSFRLLRHAKYRLIVGVGHAVFASRGMCFMSPILALAPFGWWRQFRSGTYRADALCAAVIVAGLFLFAMTTIDWRGGWGIGSRYLVSTVPFLMVGISGAIRGLKASEPLSVVFGGLAAVGVVLAAMASATVPFVSARLQQPIFHPRLAAVTRRLSRTSHGQKHRRPVDWPFAVPTSSFVDPLFGGNIRTGARHD